MLDSDRGKLGQFGRLAVLAIAAFGYAYMIWNMSAQQTRGELEATYAATDYAQSTDQQITEACGSTPNAKCIKKQVETSRESERGERDLNAQEAMARWTFIMGSVTGIGLLISMVGVGLVYITFKETRRAADAGFDANKIARESSERQMRAYISVENHDAYDFILGEKAKFRCQVHNRGQTPAYDLSIVTSLHAVVDDPNDFKVRMDKPTWQSKTVLGPGNWVGHTLVMQEQLAFDCCAGVQAGQIKMIFAGIVSYRDAFGRRRRTTFKQWFTGNGAPLPAIFELSAASKGNVAN